MAEDIRWIQRFNNYKNALKQLNDGVDLFRTRELSILEEQGLIQSFEYTHELAWNVLKDFLEYRGNTSIYGSRDASREAFSYGLINNGDTWMTMIKSRNKTTHTYNRETAKEIVNYITQEYIEEFNNLKEQMKKLAELDINND